MIGLQNSLFNVYLKHQKPSMATNTVAALAQLAWCATIRERMVGLGLVAIGTRRNDRLQRSPTQQFRTRTTGCLASEGMAISSG